LNKLLSLWDSIPEIDDVEQCSPPSLDGYGISGMDPISFGFVRKQMQEPVSVDDRFAVWVGGFKEEMP